MSRAMYCPDCDNFCCERDATTNVGASCPTCMSHRIRPADRSFGNLFRAIRYDGRNWWYHADLRERGQIAEARKREHDSARRIIAEIREARETQGAHLHIGEYGSSFHYSPTAHVSGLHAGVKAAAEMAGLPVIDTRPVPYDDRIRPSLSGPMVAVGREPDAAPYHGLSYAPLRYVARLWANAGARIANLDLTDPNTEHG